MGKDRGGKDRGGKELVEKRPRGKKTGRKVPVKQKKTPTNSAPNRFALRRRTPRASLATEPGENKYPHASMVLGLMENIFDGT